MNRKTLATDREIINEYRNMLLQFGVTSNLLNAVKELLDNISSDRQSFWQKIFEGIKSSLQGDGHKFDDEYVFLKYDNTEAYSRAYNIFNELIKDVPEHESLLYIFVETHRLVALGLSRTKDITEILSLYDILLQKFINSKDEAIEVEVARALLEKDFILGKLDKTRINEQEEIENLIIDNFENHSNPSIKNVVLTALKNNAVTQSNKQELNKEKELELNNKIINSYKDSDPNAIKLQVANAMFSKAFALFEKYIINEAKREEEILLPEEEQVDYCKETEKAYIALIERFHNNNFNKINELVVFSKFGLINLALYKKNDMETIRACQDLIAYYKNADEKIDKFYLGDALQHLAELLEKQKMYPNALAVYSQSIKEFTDHEKYNLFADIAKEAKSELEEYLKKLNEVDFKFKDINFEEKNTNTESLQEALAQANLQLDEVKKTGSSADNNVTITLSGKYNVMGIEVSKDYKNLSQEELEGAIGRALQNAKKQVDEAIVNVMEKAVGSFFLPKS